MRTVVFLLEELSARELLKGLLSRLYPSVDARYLVFEGKQDLENQLARKMRSWLAPNSIFVILRDQDAGDCRRVKDRIAERVAESGRPALIRIACRQLEAWALGDLQAVAEAFGRPALAEASRKAKFRDPDRLSSPADELDRLVQGYRKVDGARRIGRLLNPESNRSQSFRVFCEGLRSRLGEASS